MGNNFIEISQRQQIAQSLWKFTSAYLQQIA